MAEDWREERKRKQAEAKPATVTPITPEVAASLQLSDIPAMLRRMADQVERDGNVVTTMLIVGTRSDEPYPRLSCIGEALTLAEVDGLLLQAAMARKTP